MTCPATVPTAAAPRALLALSVLLAAAVVLPSAVQAAGAAAGAKATTTASAAPGNVKPELVPWDQKGTFANALSRAKKEKKLVFIDFYATWCGPCKMMDRQTYTDSAVAREAAHFINRKVDAEKGEGIQLASKYQVTAYPTLVIVDGEGKEVNREMGFRPPDRFIRFLADTRGGRTSVAALEKRIAGGDDTAENRAALGELYLKEGNTATAREQLDRALALDPKDASGRAGDLLLQLATASRTAGDHAAAAADARRYVEAFPQSPRRIEALSIVAASQAQAGQKDEAAATFRMILDSKPHDPTLLSTYARFCAALGVELAAATDSARRAVELVPGDTKMIDAVAETYAARGMWQEAVGEIEKALALKRDDPYLQGRLERFQESAATKAPPPTPPLGPGKP